MTVQYDGTLVRIDHMFSKVCGHGWIATKSSLVAIRSIPRCKQRATPLCTEFRSAPAGDQSTLSAVRDAIGAVAGGAAKSDVLAATGLSNGQWTAVINALLAEGTVTKTGAKRGTRYHLKD